jgi:ketosteroid isomerase-like protein
MGARDRDAFGIRVEFVVASLLFLSAVAQSGAQTTEGKHEILEWLAAYEEAFNAKDLQKLGAFYLPEATVYEGGGVNRGWEDYRDHHLGPELESFKELHFSRDEVAAHILDADGRSAYVISRYHLEAQVEERKIDASGLETLVLVKTAAGWRIRHSHTSSRARPAEKH